MTELRTWERENYTVNEIEFDYDLHEFEVVKDGEVIATITPDTVEDMEDMANALDNGADVNGWEDGMGNIVNVK